MVQGDEALASNKFQEALRAYQQAVKVFRQQGQREDELYTLLRIGDLYFDRLENYAEARSYFTQARSVAIESGSAFGDGLSLLGLGDVDRNQFSLLNAITRYRQALQAFEKARQQEQYDTQEYEMTVLTSLGNAYAELNRYHDAMKMYHQTLILLENPVDSELKRLRAETLRDYGTACSRAGRYGEALEYSQQALDLFNGLLQEHETMDESAEKHLLPELFRSKATVLTALGGIYEERGHDNSTHFLISSSLYRQALDIAQTYRFLQSQAVILNNLGKALDALGWQVKVSAYVRQALEAYQQSLEILSLLNLPSLTGRVRSNKGLAFLHMSVLENSEEPLRNALDMLQESRITQERIHDANGLWRTLSHLAWVYQIQGKDFAALDASREAIDILEEIMVFARVEELKISLRDQAEAAYERAILLSLKTGQREQAFEYSERARARAFLDLLGNDRPQPSEKIDAALLQQQRSLQEQMAEMEYRLGAHSEQAVTENYSEDVDRLQQQLAKIRSQYEHLLFRIKVNNPEYADLMSIAPITLPKLQRILDKDVTLLSYVVTQHTTLVFVIQREQFVCLELEIGKPELTAKISKLRRLCEQGPQADAPPPQLLQEFYVQLILPVHPYLTTSTIGIIPHDVLHYLPFAALNRPSQRNGSNQFPCYFGDDYTLFTLPGASVLPFISKKRLQSGKNSLLALANSQLSHAKVLPYTIQEAQAIQRYYARYYDADVYISHTNSKQATETRFKTFAGEYDIVHLTAHGQLEAEAPLFSSISLTPDEDNDGRVEVHELYDLNLERTKLVVLSACETQLGQRSRGDDIIGLTRAFLYAGASSVIATLWQVDDRATYELMTHFYLHLAATHSPAQALRAAQRITRAAYPHPYYWAGFVLTGIP